MKIKWSVILAYSFGTIGVVFNFGCSTCPMEKMPPPLIPSKQWENTLLTFPAEASCEIIDEFACPKPTIPSTESVDDEPSSPDCWAEHLSWQEKWKF